MASSVKDLKLWQEAVSLAGDVVRAMRQGTRREVKSFTDDVSRAAVDLAVAIGEAYASYDIAAQRRLYNHARVALVELETRLTIARQAEIIPATTLAKLGTRSATVSRLLGGYLLYLERHTAATSAATTAATNAAAPMLVRPATPAVSVVAQ